MSRLINKTGLLVAVLSIASVFAVCISPRASAVSGADWRPGNIIDDGVFFDGNSMSASDIQNFLNAKVPNCDTNGNKASEYGGGTRAQYGTSKGYPPPYTCLKNYSQGGRSAAQIIKDAATTYNISPKALLVLLQKEQTLVTDDWPWSSQYRSATGYGCPDTAPCDAEYYGFTNQVTKAAYQFRRYATYPDQYRYKPYQSNYIQYNPNSGCGGTNVGIENLATAALYNYTPYQPNSSALNNLYGSGDSCGAYGNRNFWRLFNDWFGSVRGGFVPRVNFVQFSGYPTIKAGKESTVTLRFKNVSNYETFYEAGYTQGHAPLVLANTSPINRNSSFIASGWSSANRPSIKFSKVLESNNSALSSDQHSVKPGQIVEFSYNYAPPASTPPGTYREWIQPVLEGASDWNVGGIGYFDINVTAPDYAAQYYRMSGYPTITRGSSASQWVDYKNTGSNTWYDDTTVPSGSYPVHLANSNPINRASPFSDSPSTWSNDNRPSKEFSAVFENNGSTLASNQHTVLPGQVVRFNYNYKIPVTTTPGKYREWIQPVLEGSAGWNIGAMGYIDITVTAPQNGAKYYRMSGYPTITKGSSASVWIDYQNIGLGNWYDDNSVSASNKPVHLADTFPINRESPFSDTPTTWLNNNRPSRAFTAVYESNGTTLAGNQHIVQPGQIVRFSYSYKAALSTSSGAYREWIQPVLEGATNWDIGAVGYFDIVVQ